MLNVLCLILLSAAPADPGLEEVPFLCRPFESSLTLTSPSGGYVLSVSLESDSSGRWRPFGAADYSLDRNGENVWRARLPYALCRAVLFDDGAVAGIATGPVVPAGQAEPQASNLHVVLLDSTGAERMSRVIKRPAPRFRDVGPVPYVEAMFVNHRARRMLLRIFGLPELGTQRQTRQAIMVYDMDIGQELREVQGQQLCANDSIACSSARICRTEVLTGKDLLLVHAVTYDEERRSRDGVFALLDSDGDIVWRHNLPDDYAGISAERLPGRAAGSDGVRVHCGDFLGDRIPIGNAEAPGSFWIRSLRDDGRKEFTALRDAAGAWSVREGP